MSPFTLLLGGELTRTPRLDAQIANTRIIAADAGMRHATTLGVVPELWVGDFDSAPSELMNSFSEVPRRRFPADKNETDGELAMAIACKWGATSLLLAGAFGGPRADHAFLHMTTATARVEEGIPSMLTSGAQEGTPLLPGRTGFDYGDGTLFSVIGFTALSGLTLSGVKWPLEAIDLPFGSSLTISNVVVGHLTVELGRGRAFLIAHPYPQAGF